MEGGYNLIKLFISFNKRNIKLNCTNQASRMFADDKFNIKFIWAVNIGVYDVIICAVTYTCQAHARCIFLMALNTLHRQRILIQRRENFSQPHLTSIWFFINYFNYLMVRAFKLLYAKRWKKISCEYVQ